jgi:SAM-dependent methyltransferase
VSVESIYKTMHWSNPAYQHNNQGLAVLYDWFHLLTFENGAQHDPWFEQQISIIEIGCGNGKLCRLLSDLRFDVAGIDITGGPYDHDGYGFNEVDLIKCPWSWPAYKQDWDYALCFDVLEHIEPKYMDNVLIEMSKIAKNIILKVACWGEPPLHICVESPGWWLNQLLHNCPDFDWQMIRNHITPKGMSPIFYGKKVR